MDRVTEADVEARLKERIKNTFPWIQENNVKLQKSFTIRFGHRVETISNIDLKGRSDIIVYLNDKPLFVCELKAPNIGLTEDDAKQGMSYARLHDPIVPLTVVTNSNECKFYNSFTGNELSSSIDGSDLAQLERKIKTISEECTRSLDDVLRALSGGNNDSVSDFFAELNKKAFIYFNDANIVNRKIVDDLVDYANVKLYTIVCGKAFMGKTTVAYLTSKALSQKKITNVYVDLKSSSGIFNQIERVLYEVFSTTLNNSKVKEWLRSYCRNNQIVVLVDGVNEDLFKSHSSEIIEVLEVFQGKEGKLILFADELNDNYSFNVNGKYSANPFTQEMQIKRLNHIESTEFYAFKKPQKFSLFYCLFPVCKYPLFTNSFLQVIQKSTDSSYFDVFLNSQLVLFSEKRISSDIEDFFEDFFVFYFDEYLKVKNDSDDNMAASLREREIPGVLRSALRNKFSDEKIEKLISQGFLSREKNDDFDFIDFKVPFILLKPVHDFFFKRVILKGIEEIDYILNQCERIPEGDVVAASVLYKCISKSVLDMDDVLEWLFKKKPESKQVDCEKIALYARGRLLKLDFDGDSIDYAESKMISNVISWNVLALLLSTDIINNKIRTITLRRYLTEMIEFDTKLPRFTGSKIACAEYDDENECPDCARHTFQEALTFALITTKKINPCIIKIIEKNPLQKKIAKERLGVLEFFELQVKD